MTGELWKYKGKKNFPKFLRVVKIKEGYTIKDNRGIINIQPYKTRTGLRRFLTEAGYVQH